MKFRPVPLSRPSNALRVLLQVLVLGGATLAGSCYAPRLAPEPDWTEPEEPHGEPPDWVGQPLSWEKLAAIETWLMGVGPDRAPELVPVAELELAEGRLEFTRQGVTQETPADVERRLRGAESGFRRVLGTVGTSALVRQRARDGLADTLALLGGGAAPVRGGASLAAVHPRSEWHATRPIPARLTVHRGPYTRITVHHSVQEIDHGALGATETIRKIQRVHMRDREFGDIGYHFLIDDGGRVFAGRSLEYQGAHASGSNNVDNIGVCMLGNFLHAQPSSAALRALSSLVEDLSRTYGIPRSRVYGHNELTATECPGTLMRWVEHFRSPRATH